MLVQKTETIKLSFFFLKKKYVSFATFTRVFDEEIKDFNQGKNKKCSNAPLLFS